jgi:3-oxoacyl-[acyl-carrier protein] reductase
MTVIYIGSSNTAFPLPGYALYGGSKVAPQFLVEVLEREIGHRGVSVNSIVPTAIEGMDVYGDGVSAEFRNFIKFLSSYAADGKAERCRKCKRISCGGSDGFVSWQHLLVAGGAPAQACEQNCWQISQQKNLKPF